MISSIFSEMRASIFAFFTVVWEFPVRDLGHVCRILKYRQKYIEKFNDNELQDLEKLLFIEDEIIYNWYFKKISNGSIPNTKVALMLKKFKL